MNLQFVDRVAVTDVVLDAGHRHGADDTDNAAGARHSQQWFAHVVVCPCARVEVFFRVGIGVALSQSYVSTFWALVNAHAVTAHAGEYQWLALLQVMIKLHPKQWLSVILLHVATVLVQWLVRGGLVLGRSFAPATTLSSVTSATSGSVAAMSASGRIAANAAFRLVTVVLTVFLAGCVCLGFVVRLLHLDAVFYINIFLLC